MSRTPVLKPGSCSRFSLTTVCSLVTLATLGAAAAAEEVEPTKSGQRPQPLAAELPDGGSVELLGLIRSWEKSAVRRP